MRCQAVAPHGAFRQGAQQVLAQGQQAFWRADEARLLRGGRLAAEAGILVQHRQQGHADARVPGSLHQAQGQFGRSA
jgi:hypothetical protein